MARTTLQCARTIALVALCGLLPQCSKGSSPTVTNEPVPARKPVASVAVDAVKPDASNFFVARTDAGIAEAPRATKHAIEYFNAKSPAVMPAAMMVLSFLKRKFRLTELSSSVAPARNELTPATRKDLGLFLRVVDPSVSATESDIHQLGRPIDIMTASALFCDRVPLTDGYPTTLHDLAAKGGYEVTHAALATEWAIENGCLTGAGTTALHQQQVALLEALPETSERDDKRIEAIAMLFYIGERKRVKPAWLTMILGLQRPDGGWAYGAELPVSNDHTTVLALWALLEASNPKAERVPWLSKSVEPGH